MTDEAHDARDRGRGGRSAAGCSPRAELETRGAAAGRDTTDRGHAVRQRDQDDRPRQRGQDARGGAADRRRAHVAVAADEPRSRLDRRGAREARAQGSGRQLAAHRPRAGADLRADQPARRGEVGARVGGDGRARLAGVPQRRRARQHDRRLVRHVPSPRRQHAPGDVSQVPAPARPRRAAARHDQLVHRASGARHAARRRTTRRCARWRRTSTRSGRGVELDYGRR